MSKKRKTKNTPQKIIRIGLVLLVIVLLLFAVKEIINKNTEENKTQSTETSSQKEKNTEKKEEKEESEEKEGDQSENEEKQTIKSYDGEDPNKQAELTGTITTARVLDEELIIRIEIDQFLISGTCEQTLTKGEKKYSEKTNILADASTSTCEGFNVPINSLEGGVWKIEIRVFSGEKTGEIKGEANI